MAWTTLSFPFGSILTSAKMTQLYDNFAAFAAKDAGAPVLANSYVTTAMIASLNITNALIANNTIDFAAKMLNKSNVGSWSVAGKSYQTINVEGVLNLSGSSSVWQFEIYQNTVGWQSIYPAPGTNCAAIQLISDATNVRAFNDAVGSNTLYYRRLY